MRRTAFLFAILGALGLVLPAGAQETAKQSPGFDAKALWDGRKIAPFKGLDNPKMLKASEADVDDGEYVLGITVNGESRAYPTRYVWWHHVVNDRVGDMPFAITYCSVCNTGIRYDLKLEDKTLSLDFYGLYSAVVALYDRETETVWAQASGEGMLGPLAGKKLKSQPLLDTTWGEWKKLHPDTLVMSGDTPFARFYRPKDRPENRDYKSFPAPFFAPTLRRGDKRLPPFDKVLGVAVTGDGEKVTRRAYPVAALKEAGAALNDTVDGQPIAVFFNPEVVSAFAVSRVLEGQTLTFEARKLDTGGEGIFDKETGTRWSLEGRGESGPLAGKQLTPVESHLSQWYGWAAFYPETTIYGRTDPPQPVDPQAGN